MTVSDFDAVFVKHPKKAADMMAWHRKRIAIIESGGRRGQYETVEEHAQLAERYERALRAKGLCLLNGCSLDDLVSVWRGYGPVCWTRLDADAQAAAVIRAVELNGPRPGRLLKVATTPAEAEAQLAAALGFADPKDRF